MNMIRLVGHIFKQNGLWHIKGNAPKKDSNLALTFRSFQPIFLGKLQKAKSNCSVAKRLNSLSLSLACSVGISTLENSRVV